MAIDNMDRRWDEISRLIDQITRLRAERRLLQTDAKQVHSDLLAASWEANMRRTLPAAAEPKSPGAVVYPFGARRRPVDESRKPPG